MASALRSAILRHVRLPVSQAFTARGSVLSFSRWMSSHDDHLSKQEVVERVLDVVKSFPKVDPSKVSTSIPLYFLRLLTLIRSEALAKC